MSYNFEIPNNWKELTEDKFKILGLESSENIVCLASFLVGNEEDSNIISFINYIEFDKSFLIELDKCIEKINELNELVDGKSEDKDYEDTSVIFNIFHGFNQTENCEFYISINRIKVSEANYKYSFQIFCEAKTGILCAQTTLTSLDENNAIESALTTNFVNDAVKILLNLKEIK